MRTFIIVIMSFLAAAYTVSASAQSSLDDVDKTGQGAQDRPGLSGASPSGFEATMQSGYSDKTAIVDKRSFSARVLGGGDAQAGEYPSMVAIVQSGFGARADRFFCGGTLVAERWVLTAAHCVFDVLQEQLEPDSLRIVAGIQDLALDDQAPEINVLSIVIHPDYDNELDLPPNDIALLELESAVAEPIASLFAGDTDSYVEALGFIAGWGAIDDPEDGKHTYPTRLQEAVVPLISDDECNSPQSYDGSIVKSHVCAGYADGEIDACLGDSGGPLFINVDGTQVQAGITSFGIGCGLPLFYGIYTDLSYFIPWLEQYIEVPYQSPELVARRASEDNPMYTGSDAGGARMTGGALGWISVLMLLGIRHRRIAS